MKDSIMIGGFMYILKCSDESYYTGSTVNLMKRIREHQEGLGSNHTRTFAPVELVYFEEFHRIDFAFNREKQIQGWTRKKKEALIASNIVDLKKYSECTNSTHHASITIGIEPERNESIVISESQADRG